MTTKRTRLYRRLAICTSIGVLVLLCLPGSWIEALQSYINVWPPSESESTDFPIDKVVHAFLFSLCAALFIRGWNNLRQRWYLVCALLLLYGLVTELIQRYIPGRSSSFGDLLADGAGIGFGVGIALVYLRKRQD